MRWRPARAERLDGRWQFTVADDGPGVPDNQRQRIFAMFIRGTTGDDHDGHGMGLALCRRIVESYEGHIWVEDNPGGGSRFRFTLPATSP
jgi:signal transduction histidine kinase